MSKSDADCKYIRASKLGFEMYHIYYLNKPAQLHSEGMGALWLSGRVLDSRPRGRRFKPHRRHCVVSLSKTH